MEDAIIEKSAFDEVLGLSCIENYVLAVLSKHMALSYLYYDSIVDLRDAIDEILADRVGFAFFRQIPRLHKLAMDIGILSYNSARVDSIQDAVGRGAYRCIEVRPEWFTNRYHVSTWRDDHFILVDRKGDNAFRFVNDNPRDEGVVSMAEAESLFAGKVFYFSVINPTIDDRKDLFLDIYRKKLMSLKPIDASKRLPQGFDYLNLRDFLGIVKISRKRMEAFSRNYIDTDFMLQYLNQLDRKYVEIEYMRLRNKENEAAKSQIINDVIAWDAAMVGELIREIGGGVHGWVQ